MMNHTRLIALVTGSLALGTLVMGCSNERDGSATRAACVSYVDAANACWSAASGEGIVDASMCDQIDTDVATAEVDDASTCGTQDLEALYLCFAEAFNDEVEGLCTSVDTAGTVDVSDCVHSCDRCPAGKQRCDGTKAQYCDAASGAWKTLLTCPDHTTCKKGECLAPEPEAEPEPTPESDASEATDTATEIGTDEDAGPDEESDAAAEADTAADTAAPDADTPDTDTPDADACTPACDGKLCGDDGCGESCGDCADGQTCNAGACE
jgi:hypothetical protein